MLNRRQIRIKALQTLYSHFQSGDISLRDTEDNLKRNMDKLYELYVWQLSILVEIIDFAEERIEDAKKKFLPTEEDLNPNTKFIDNRFIRKLRNNKDYRRLTQKYKVNWGGERELIRHLFMRVKDSFFYEKYMKRSDDDFERDKSVLIDIIRYVLADDDLLRDFLEEKYFLWSEDYYMALSFVMTTIGDFGPRSDADTKLPSLFKASFDENGRNEDELFLYNLVRKTITGVEKYDEIIKAKAKNWEFERIAVMDLILLRMGMTEAFEFETIPLKVTLNEIIELAKHFSSPKSKVFINGLLDKTIEEGLANGDIVKKGRGLIGG